MKSSSKAALQNAISEMIQLHAFDHLLDNEQAEFRNILNQWLSSEYDPAISKTLSSYLFKANLFSENVSPASLQQWIYAMSRNQLMIADNNSVFEEEFELA
ncbi:MAG: hypothetical protein ACOVNO_11690 [Sediminibacterium sp.]|jgi:hypothetical protein